jgi:hypothetical protein
MVMPFCFFRESVIPLAAPPGDFLDFSSPLHLLAVLSVLGFSFVSFVVSFWVWFCGGVGPDLAGAERRSAGQLAEVSGCEV